MQAQCLEKTRHNYKNGFGICLMRRVDQTRDIGSEHDFADYWQALSPASKIGI